MTSTELRALLALNVVVASATALVVVNTVIYVRTLLDGDDRGLALTLACWRRFDARSTGVACSG